MRHRTVHTYCVLKKSCNSALLSFERVTSSRVTMCPLSTSNGLLERIGPAESSANDNSVWISSDWVAALINYKKKMVFNITPRGDDSDLRQPWRKSLRR